MQEGPPLAPFWEVLMEVKEDGAMLAQENSGLAGDTARAMVKEIVVATAVPTSGATVHLAA